DPNTNGRVYRAHVRARDAAQDRAQYGIDLVRLYLTWLGVQTTSLTTLPLKGTNIFELGPGPSMATAMAFAALGGTVFVKEREDDSHWRPEFHGATADRMLGLFRQRDEPFDAEPLERSMAQAAFDPERIVIVNDEPAVAMDYTVSAAVLEHVENLR